jgi:hypothetical protein
MTLEEYKGLIIQINKEANLKRLQVGRKFAISNNTISIGDKITDHIGSIIVQKITVYHSEIPQCVYDGVEINKNGKENKKGKTRAVYESNIK